MADYYVILKRAVGVLPEGTREQRQAIYDKARKALLAQLQNMDPPLAPSEISKQRMALEEAVRSVERDLTLEKDYAKAKEDAKAPLAAPAVSVGERGGDDPKSSQAPAAPEVSVDDAGRDEAQGYDADAEGPDDDAEASPSRPANDRGERQQDVEPLSPSDKVIRRAGQDVLKNAVRDANAIGAATNAAVKSAKDAGDAVAEQPTKREREPRVEAPRGDVRVEPSLGQATVTTVTSSRSGRDTDSATKDGPIAGLHEDEPESKSRLGIVVAGLLLVGALGGSGYLLYEHRDEFLAMVNGTNSDEGEVVVASEDTGDTGTSGEETIPSKTVRTVTVTPPAEEGTTDSGEAPAVEPTEQNDTASDEVATAPDETDTATSAEQPADVEIAERSILYEEAGPNGEPGTADAGETLWSLEGEGDDAVVVIAATIPDQNVSYDIRISKNSDPELPASHLIEITVIRDDDAPDKAIASIPGLILKPTEQTRGEGLIGAAIPISEDMHWIALTAGEREIRYNLELLLLRSWIDIPLQYASKRRAILTLEKGESGDAVIADAIKEWSGQ